MADNKPLEVQEKKELVAKGEKTVPARYYTPHTDIRESEDALLYSIATVFPRMMGGSCPPHGLRRFESATANCRISARPRHTPSVRLKTRETR